jgi:hypothetical protein
MAAKPVFPATYETDGHPNPLLSGSFETVFEGGFPESWWINQVIHSRS